MYGHHGKILKVNLSTATIVEESYDETVARLFLGGNGLAAKLIFEMVPPDADPLGPQNTVVFTVGPITDTPVWGTSRGHMAAISPMTGLFADSNYGGQFGTAQKRTGFDAICITGKASKPVYLVVTEKGADIRDASALWGKSTEETISFLQSQEGKGAICAAIGPAGERGVLFANVICGGKRSGAAGRGGMGTVLGSKQVKAVVVKGNRKTQIADREALSRLLKSKYEAFQGNTKALHTYGTPVLVNTINALGMLGTHNNSVEEFDLAEEISGQIIKEHYWKEDIACHGCPVACGKNVTAVKGVYADKPVKMPEYETLYAMGSMNDNPSIDTIINANHLCDLMGVDTISMGVTLAFAAECMERGIITDKDLGGTVRFAGPQNLFDLIEKTVLREGVGKHLSLGSARLAEKFGHEADKYLHAVKKLEIAGHSPRGLRSMSLSYAVSTRGGSHHDGRPNYAAVDPDPGFDPQPEYVVKSNYFTAVGDSLVICRFIAERGIGTPLNEDMAKVVNAVTGWSLSLEDLERIGERIYNQERLINVQRGVSRKDDILPYRVMEEPIPGGPAKGRHCPQKELDHMLDRYYELRGWSSDGIPTDATLEELGLK
jgi:aldehyde:ferredoxin oxidoreductase